MSDWEKLFRGAGLYPVDTDKPTVIYEGEPMTDREENGPYAQYLIQAAQLRNDLQQMRDDPEMAVQHAATGATFERIRGQVREDVDRTYLRASVEFAALSSQLRARARESET